MDELLKARVEIADLVHTYALNIRNGNGVACAPLFTEDAVFEVREALVIGAVPPRTRSRLTGRDAITQYVSRTSAPEMRVCPLIHNLLVEVHGRTASSTCIMISLVWAGGKQLVGEYQDSYRFENGWRFTSRIFTILGKLSNSSSP